jgi:hypothetical protein
VRDTQSSMQGHECAAERGTQFGQGRAPFADHATTRQANCGRNYRRHGQKTVGHTAPASSAAIDSQTGQLDLCVGTSTTPSQAFSGLFSVDRDLRRLRKRTSQCNVRWGSHSLWLFGFTIAAFLGFRHIVFSKTVFKSVLDDRVQPRNRSVNSHKSSLIIRMPEVGRIRCLLVTYYLTPGGINIPAGHITLFTVPFRASTGAARAKGVIARPHLDEEFQSVVEPIGVVTPRRFTVSPTTATFDAA